MANFFKNIFVPHYSPRRIKHVRKISTLTPTMFASVLGISYEMLERWENGEIKLTLYERSQLRHIYWRGLLDRFVYFFLDKKN